MANSLRVDSRLYIFEGWKSGNLKMPWIPVFLSLYIFGSLLKYFTVYFQPFWTFFKLHMEISIFSNFWKSYFLSIFLEFDFLIIKEIIQFLNHMLHPFPRKQKIIIFSNLQALKKQKISKKWLFQSQILGLTSMFSVNSTVSWVERSPYLSTPLFTGWYKNPNTVKTNTRGREKPTFVVLEQRFGSKLLIENPRILLLD